jgi:hypothetical protein
MKKMLAFGATLGLAGFVASPMTALAQAPTAPPTPAAEPAAPTSNAMTTPALTGPLVANPNPLAINLPNLNLPTIYATGVLSGFALEQSDAIASDHEFRYDLDNAHLILQTTEGLIQFYAQAGYYSFPAVGYSYLNARRTTGDTFGWFPVGYLKLAPSDTFSVQAGKLPTLIGAEYAFTFQNMNIERGLLWFQEPITSRGVQGNLTVGPVALSISLNDGYYTSNYNWLTGLATWTIDKQNTLAVAAGGNFGQTRYSNAFTTPLAQNNSRIVNVIYTYNNAPWVITPYFQYTNVPDNASLGLTDSSTYGAAILASYTINDNWSIAGRAEVIGSDGALNLLGYGAGSTAYSFTLTPTYQEGIFFARAEGSIVGISDRAPGLGFGKSGSTDTQGRFVVEAGVMF